MENQRVKINIITIVPLSHHNPGHHLELASKLSGKTNPMKSNVKINSLAKLLDIKRVGTSISTKCKHSATMPIYLSFSSLFS